MALTKGIEHDYDGNPEEIFFTVKTCLGPLELRRMREVLIQKLKMS
jgi:hypothetical protein